VLGDYEEVYGSCIKLKRNIEKLRDVREHNLEDDVVRTTRQVRNLKRCRFWCCTRTVDLEHYYIDKINEIKAGIR
jgi:hypothetical protein